MRGERGDYNNTCYLYGCERITVDGAEKLTGTVESDGEDGVMIKICRGMNG